MQNSVLQEDGTLFKAEKPSTNHIAKWQRVEAILAQPPTMVHKAYVTSTEWGQIAKELEGMDVEDPSQPTIKPKPQNFKRCRVGKCLTLVNAGTEDQETVDLLNRLELGDDAKKFAFRREFFRKA